MWELIAAVAGPPAKLFALIIVLSAAALAADFAVPQFREWTRLFLLVSAGAAAMGPAIDAVRMMDGLVGKMTGLFLGIYPVLAAGMAAAGGALSLINWNPAVFLFVQGAVVIGGKWMVPLLIVSFILDYLSRLVPEIPFTRISEMIRVTLLGAISVIIACYSLFITATGAMAWSSGSALAEPIKALLRQHVPLIGSFITDTMGVVGKYSSGMAPIAGSYLIVALLVTSLSPVAYVLLTAFLYKWIAALCEPFAHEDLAGFFDDIGKTLFVLCGIMLIVAFAIFYTAVLSIILIKVIAGAG
ncbi:stage III sporulation protein AE [Bhargavaea cecembensis DSE10]|uniref:Stage III sporulation protein AE n=1 Tax=Bhargavaea cecembensis DSE10 TaxID=1235279 RepID=M7NHF4_9BACL|nr:stage III sporulation protein AE [Bhargavaea cecembensis]EMR06672.1 stage III sporulation protein AE [Bhargavaea cecembensis DSE10]